MATDQGSTPQLSRRDLMRGAATTGAGAVTLHAADDLGLDLSPVDEAQAVVPAMLIIAGATATAVYLKENSSGTSAESAVKDAAKADLKTDFYRTVVKRQSENDSRIVSTEDIANLSRDTAYEQAKIAAFTPLQEGATEQEVVNTAQDAVDDYFAIPKENILAQWNESVTELINYVTEIGNQGFALEPFFGFIDLYNGLTNDSINDISSNEVQITVNGSNQTVKRLHYKETQERNQHDEPNDFPTYTADWGPSNAQIDRESDAFITVDDPDDPITYLRYSDWNNIWSKINTAQSEVKSGVSTWVNTVYGNLQAGEISLQEIASNLDLAQRALEDEDVPRAKADLMAMNLPTDLDRAVTVSYSRDGVDWTATGMFAALSDTAPTWEVGTTYDPANSGTPSVVLATNGDSVSGVWSDYQTAVDGGIVVLTSKPISGPIYQIETTAGESATAKAADFSKNANGNWEYDFSGSLDSPITELASVTIYPAKSVDYQVVLDHPFTIEAIKDQETGEEFTTTETTRLNDPQNDSNYITADQWDQLQTDREQQYAELEELFKEVAASGSSSGNWWSNNFPGFPPARKVAIAAGGTLAGLLGINAATS